MNYLTANETAEKWNISERRVTKLCNEGRIKGALKKGAMWLIPMTTGKPADKRKVQSKEQVKC